MKETNISSADNWLTNRFHDLLDWLWFGSVLCVAIVVATIHGIGYVPLFVLGWFVVFVRVMRKKINESTQMDSVSTTPVLTPVMDAESVDHTRRKKSIKGISMAICGFYLVFGALGILNLYGIVSIYAIAILSMAINCLFISPYLSNHRAILVQISHRPHGKLHYALIVCAWCAVAWMFFRYDLGYAIAGRLVFENMWLIVLAPLALLIVLFGFIYSHILYRNILYRRKES